MRLATTRARRRRSPPMIARSARGVHATATPGAEDTATALRTNWLTWRSSRCSRIAPASNRLISSRSSTRPRKRATSLTSRSSAACARSGISSRRASMTSTEADSVISGERSSWLTSDANRASRSTRSWSAEAMSLNDVASTPRSGSSVGVRRVSSRPPAIAFAASDASATGRTARRAASTPTSTPRPVVIVAASSSERATLDSVWLSSSRLKNSKYAPWTASRLIPTTTTVSPLTSAIMRASSAIVDDPSDEVGRDRLLVVASDRPRPVAAELQHEVLGAGRLERLDRLGHVRGVGAPEPLRGVLRVAVRLLEARRVSLAGEVRPNEPVGGERQERRQSERARA